MNKVGHVGTFTCVCRGFFGTDCSFGVVFAVGVDKATTRVRISLCLLEKRHGTDTTVPDYRCAPGTPSIWALHTPAESVHVGAHLLILFHAELVDQAHGLAHVVHAVRVRGALVLRQPLSHLRLEAEPIKQDQGTFVDRRRQRSFFEVAIYRHLRDKWTFFWRRRGRYCALRQVAAQSRATRQAAEATLPMIAHCQVKPPKY